MPRDHSNFGSCSGAVDMCSIGSELYAAVLEGTPPVLKLLMYSTTREVWDIRLALTTYTQGVILLLGLLVQSLLAFMCMF